MLELERSKTASDASMKSESLASSLSSPLPSPRRTNKHNINAHTLIITRIFKEKNRYQLQNYVRFWLILEPPRINNCEYNVPYMKSAGLTLLLIEKTTNIISCESRNSEQDGDGQDGPKFRLHGGSVIAGVALAERLADRHLRPAFQTILRDKI